MPQVSVDIPSINTLSTTTADTKTAPPHSPETMQTQKLRQKTRDRMLNEEKLFIEAQRRGTASVLQDRVAPMTRKMQRIADQIRNNLYKNNNSEP